MDLWQCKTHQPTAWPFRFFHCYMHSILYIKIVWRSVRREDTQVMVLVHTKSIFSSPRCLLNQIDQFMGDTVFHFLYLAGSLPAGKSDDSMDKCSAKANED